MNLREAAKQALEALEDHATQYPHMQKGYTVDAITSLRAALAENAMQRLTDEQQMIERGTKAWAGVPNATEWVEDLRGNEPVTICHDKEGDKLASPSDHVPDATKMMATSRESRQVEPVAWLSQGGDVSRSKRYFEEMGFTDLIPLYIAAPKREPLTEKQIESAVCAASADTGKTSGQSEDARGMVATSQESRQVEPVATINKMETIEPVAWLQIGVGDHEGTVIATTTKPKTWNPAWWRFEPLYTAPPKREPLKDCGEAGHSEGRCGNASCTVPPKREPLTDEEISKIFIYCGRDKETFARAIERAHGIGGE